MPEIYTSQWYDELKELLNRSPDVESNAPDGKYHILARIEGDDGSPYLEPGQIRLFVIRFEERKCVSYQEVGSAPSRKDFDFIFELPASVFEAIAAGQLDLVEAGLKGLIRVTGDMRVLIQHAELVNALYEVYSKEIETLWPKGKPEAPPA